MHLETERSFGVEEDLERLGFAGGVILATELLGVDSTEFDNSGSSVTCGVENVSEGVESKRDSKRREIARLLMDPFSINYKHYTE